MTSLNLDLLTQTLLTFFTNYHHLLPNYVPNSQKVNILLWKVKNQPNSFILKIANQKYLSDYRVDKNGEGYWKFKEVEEEVIKTNSDSTPPIGEAVVKFYTRQAKSEALNDHAKSNNSSHQSESVSN